MNALSPETHSVLDARIDVVTGVSPGRIHFELCNMSDLYLWAIFTVRKFVVEIPYRIWILVNMGIG